MRILRGAACDPLESHGATRAVFAVRGGPVISSSRVGAIALAMLVGCSSGAQSGRTGAEPPDARDEAAVEDVVVADEALPDASVDVTARDVAPAIDTSVVEVAAGNAHACARRADGTARCWGAFRVGQLGIGHLYAVSW